MIAQMFHFQGELTMRPVFYVLDGHAIAYRQFFGLPMGSFSAPDGTPTNAVFGFTRILLDILEKDRPQYVAVSFDMGMSGREALYEEYKGTREKMPDELSVQLDWIQTLVRAFNMPILALEGYEADDVIGTVTQQAVAEGVDVRIITGDRDLLQLLTEHVTVQLPARDGTPDVVYDIARFRERFQLEPPQLIDLKALMGDSSDNIPGVKGIGEKTAQKLLDEFKTLDGVYENIELVKGANQRKLIDGRELAYLSRKLATILTDVPYTLDLKRCHSHDYQVDDVLALFDQLNFRTLRNRLLKMHTPQNVSLFGDDLLDDSPTSDEDFAPPAQAEQLFTIHVVRTEAQLAELVERLKSADVISFDTESTSVDQMAAELVGISLAVDAGSGWYVPVAHHAGTQLPLERVIEALRPALTDPKIPKIAHNAIYDMVVLQRFGIDVAPVVFDTMIAEWVIDSQSKNLGLKNLAYARLKDDDGRAIYMTPISDLIGTGKNQKLFSEVPIEQAAPYAASDAVMTRRLYDPLREELVQDGLADLYQTLEIPLIPVLASMERAGVVIDTRFLDEMSQQLAIQLHEIEQEIYALAGGYGTFNINSPKQLNDVLFGKLGLPTRGLKKTAQGYSTDAATLDSLLDAHPIVQKIIDYRELAKLKGTYVDALPQLINGQTGRVHTSYNQTGTATGRISSSDPNLQNIPIRTKIGREVRRAFVAPPGKLLLGVDYSQVELRVLAHYSRDETLLDAFRRGEDIHRATAAAVFGIPIDAVTYEQRSFAKRVNFGLIYGMGAFRLARDSELTLQEANKFIETYFARLPRVQEYLNSTKQQARQEEGLKTLFGRRRRFPALMSGKGNRQTMMAEERAAINFPIQGSAADIIKRAMINLHAALAARGSKAVMILQVHDELVFEVPEDEIEATRALAVETMEQAYPLDPPLRVEAEVGQNWRDMA
jgi:DNA polymerase-1